MNPPSVEAGARTVTLVTATYGPDLERFALQRESIERCGVMLPHVAIVHTEDVATFREIPFRQNLTILATAEVLPAAIERRRRRGPRDLRRLSPTRWFGGKTIHGWYTQQLVKLAAADVVRTEGYVCLDADVFLCGPLSDADFFAADGRLHLYETVEDLDVEMVEWLVDSMRFLGIGLRQKPAARYIHHPLPMHRRVVLELQAYVEARFHRPWAEAMADASVTEAMTYGAYARHLHAGRLVAPTLPSTCLYYWWPEQLATMDADFRRRVAESQARAVLVQSNLSVPVKAYRHLAEAAWTRDGAR